MNKFKMMMSNWFGSKSPVDEFEDVLSFSDALSTAPDARPVNITVVTLNGKPLVGILNESDLDKTCDAVIAKIKTTYPHVQVIRNGRAIFITDQRTGRIIYTLTSHPISLLDRVEEQAKSPAPL